MGGEGLLFSDFVRLLWTSHFLWPSETTQSLTSVDPSATCDIAASLVASKPFQSVVSHINCCSFIIWLDILCNKVLSCFYQLFGVATFCSLCASVWCVEYLVWLGSVHFVWEVSCVWTVWYGYVLYNLCTSVWCGECLKWLGSVQFVCECLICGVFGVATVCTVCVGSVWCGYVLYSLCGDCLVCGLCDVATACAIWVGSVRCWTVCYGYVLNSLCASVWCVECFCGCLYILCGECLVCDLFGVDTFCTFCVMRIWCVDCLTKTSESKCS